mgnify:FL=1
MKLNKATIKNYKDFCEINKGIFDIHLRKEKINKNDPDLYIVDVFASFIKDNNKAYQEDLSDVFDELYQAIEHLEDVLHIPKRITKQIKGI